MPFKLDDIIKAYFSCRSHKRKTINALKFESEFESRLLKLQKELEDHSYHPGRSICFIVTHPKPREVFAADFRDRIVHHLLVHKLEPFFEKRFISDSFACRKKKGTHKGIARLNKFVGQVTENRTQNAYYAQIDIKSFFTSIDKNILLDILNLKIERMKQRVEWQHEIFWLTKTIILHNPTRSYYLKGDERLFKLIPSHKTLFKTSLNRGLPIGNLTSQFFGNVYLNEVDQFIKRRLKVRYYLRYVDDMVLLSRNLDQLKSWREEINNFLKGQLKLELHPNKDKFDSVYSGIDFTGYITKPEYTLSRKRVISNLKTKLYYFNQGLLLVSNNQKQVALPLTQPPDQEEVEQMLAMVNSYYGHFCHANCYNLRKNLYEKHFGILKNYLRPTNNFQYFRKYGTVK